MKALLTGFGIGYLILAAFAYFFSDAMIFFPPRSSYQYDKKIIELKTADNENIAAVYLHNKTAKYTVLVSHGNAEDIGCILPFLNEWYKQNFSVFAYDYHGYGLSSGKPSEANTYLDIDAAYEYLTKSLHIAPENIIVYGRSVGAAVALDLAVRQPVGGLIMESPFVTAFRVMSRIPLLPFDKFNNIKKIRHIKCPVLVIHGTSDHIVPFWQGQKIYNAAPLPKQYYWVKNADHNNLFFVAGAEYWQAIDGFIKFVETRFIASLE